MACEDEVYTAASQKIIKELKGWKIMPLICYDLRFPVWSRNVDLEYDLLIYIANWPDPRRNAWTTLLQARAIENLSYTIGVNRVGKDAKELNYTGDSSIVDFKGNVLFHQLDEEVIHTHILDKSEQDSFREKFPVNMDADRFEIL